MLTIKFGERQEKWVMNMLIGSNTFWSWARSVWKCKGRTPMIPRCMLYMGVLISIGMGPSITIWTKIQVHLIMIHYRDHNWLSLKKKTLKFSNFQIVQMVIGIQSPHLHNLSFFFVWHWISIALATKTQIHPTD